MIISCIALYYSRPLTTSMLLVYYVLAAALFVGVIVLNRGFAAKSSGQPDHLRSDAH
jgi:hypothetical protein